MVNDSHSEAGRACPLRYRYGAQALASVAPVPSGSLLVVGGLYGNRFALQAVLELFKAEQQQDPSARLCFNGDFNWFNTHPEAFAHINDVVLKHDCVLGNVEAELPEPLDAPDCGCAYPDGVDQAVVDRSNQIHTRLKQTAQAHPELLAQIVARPFFARYQVGQAAVAVVHGDADSLAGWGFDPTELAKPNTQEWLKSCFQKAQVDVFASSHTCSAVLSVQPEGVVSNNGAAGMPSAPGGSLAGLVTRISSKPFSQTAAVWQSARVKGVWVEQIRLEFDQAAWREEFLSQWPPGSPAYESYFQRITQGVG